MKIWSMLQVLSQVRRRWKKKLTKNDSLCICVIGEGVFIWVGVGWGDRGGKKDRRLRSLKIIKGVFLFIGSASKWNQENSYAPLNTSSSPPWCHFCPLPIVYLVYTHTLICDRGGHRSRISMTSLCFRSDLRSVTLGNFIPLPTWVFGQDRGLKRWKRWKVVARPNRNVQ